MAKKIEYRIAFDIGNHSIKMVSYHQKGSDGLSQLALINLVDKERAQRPQDVNDLHIGEGIRHLINQLPYKKASLRVCLSATMNNLFVVTIPEVAEQELKQALFWELGPLLPDPVKNYEYDYQLLNHNHKRKKMTVLIGVVEKGRLERIFKLFGRLGKGVDILETDTLSALDLFLTQYPDSEETVGFLQLGATHCNYAILSPEQDARFLFLPFGGNKLSDVLVKAKEIPFLSAEELRRGKQPDLPLDEGEESLPLNSPEIDDALKKFATTIVQFNIHHHHRTDTEVSKIFVTGGLLNDRFVEEALNREDSLLNVPCEFWDPVPDYFPAKSVDSKNRYHFASALGLALR